MYGIQTTDINVAARAEFENDVKMYGIQTNKGRLNSDRQFENDVKMYGIQTRFFHFPSAICLRMM